MNQTTTPNHSTSYVMFFMNLKGGPVVVDIPAAGEQALYGTLINAWNEPQINVGNTGHDKGKGARYVMLPPGYEGEPPAGYVPVRSSTYNNYSLLRIITKTRGAEDVEKGIAYLHSLRVYPLSNAASPVANEFIDVAGEPFEAVPVYDASFYTSLARMVAEEDVQDRDLAIMGQLYSLNIGKGLTFDPDAATKVMLNRAVAEAHQWMMEGYATNGTPIWPEAGRAWRFLLDIPLAEGTKVTFVQPGKDLRVDVRAAAWFAMFGPVVPPPPQLYVRPTRRTSASGSTAAIPIACACRRMSRPRSSGRWMFTTPRRVRSFASRPSSASTRTRPASRRTAMAPWMSISHRRRRPVRKRTGF
jgi:hypothetical protein